MLNFNYYNPIRIIFGRDTIRSIDDYIPQNARVLITYGGGSIKKNGTLDEVKAALHSRYFIEFSGIEPNPSVETLSKAKAVIQSHNIDFLLAVGGGSVIDGTKYIAAEALYDGDMWALWRKREPIKAALPFGCVLTLPATGSEMNATAVVSYKKYNLKLSHKDPQLFSKFSILDPTKTYSLPVRQISNGVVDAFIHVLEQYLTYPVYGKIQDRYAEGILLTLLEDGPKALVEPENYDLRATIMWSATQALNTLIGLGVPQDWATHAIGHQLTALYGLDHGVTLAIILPALLRIQAKDKKLKLLQYGQRVWGINEGDDNLRVEKAIEKTEAFFNDMGIATRLSAHGIPIDAIDKIISHIDAINILPLGEHKNIDLQALRKILSLAY